MQVLHIMLILPLRSGPRLLNNPTMKSQFSPRQAELTPEGKVRPCSLGMLLSLHTATLPSCAAAEVTMFDEVVVCYKFIGDLMFYVTGSQDENELILYTVLVAFYESVTLLLRCAGVDQHSHKSGLMKRLTGVGHMQRCCGKEDSTREP